MQDNKGVSLVELIVVIAIMAVLAGGGVSLFGTLTGARLSEASDKITAALSRTRTEALSRSDASFMLYQDSDKQYYVKISYTLNSSEQVITEKVGASTLAIEYVDTQGARTTINTANQLIVKFDRATGGLKPLADGGTTYLKTINISSGARQKTITLYTLTGKYEVQ